MDECANYGACGSRAVCRNLEGGYECSCPPGFDGDPRVGCFENVGCAHAKCGRDAQCLDLPGAYKCICPPGLNGDPNVECTGKN